MNIKLSVIVPCYNVAQYLEGFLACLDKQWGEHDNYEVVFVNDGSTDSTPSLLAEYVAADTRHRVLINQANQGVSGARNAGIKVARGEWIAFADPDDLLAEGGYSLLMSKCLDDSIDVLSFKFKQIGENESFQPTRPLSTEVIWEGTTYDRAELLLQSVWYCIYSKAILERYDIKFNVNTTFAEDALFNASLFSKGVRIRMVDTMIYYYVQHAQSICHTQNLSTLRKNVEGLLFCLDEVRRYQLPNFPIIHWTKFFAIAIVMHLMRGNFCLKEVRVIHNRLLELNVLPLTSPWWSDRICFKILEHPWLLPIVKFVVRVKHYLKK